MAQPSAAGLNRAKSQCAPGKWDEHVSLHRRGQVMGAGSSEAKGCLAVGAGTSPSRQPQRESPPRGPGPGHCLEPERVRKGQPHRKCTARADALCRGARVWGGGPGRRHPPPHSPAVSGGSLTHSLWGGAGLGAEGDRLGVAGGPPGPLSASKVRAPHTQRDRAWPAAQAASLGFCGQTDPRAQAGLQPQLGPALLPLLVSRSLRGADGADGGRWGPVAGGGRRALAGCSPSPGGCLSHTHAPPLPGSCRGHGRAGG